MNNKKARENFQALLKGKTPPRVVSTAEAKARLRATDPAIDISRFLVYLGRGEVKQAGSSLAVEVATTVTIPYVRPLLNSAFLSLGNLLTTNKKHSRK